MCEPHSSGLPLSAPDTLPLNAVLAFPLVNFRASFEVIEDTYRKEGNNRGVESVFDVS